MYDDNFDLEIDNEWEEEVLTSDDCYIEEVDNTIWITELINSINLEDL